MRDRGLVIAALAVIAVIIVGEVYVYAYDRDGMYDVDTTVDGTELAIAVSSGGSDEYDILVADNGGFAPADRCIVYYDESYADRLDDAWHATGGRDLDQEYYVSQLLLQLENRGVGAEVVDAAELGRSMADWISDGDCGQALIVVSGALPDRIYTGGEGDPVLEWLDMGGRLYWAGNLLGAYVSHEDGVTEAEDGYQTLLLGAECQDASASTGHDIIDNGLRDALSLAGSDLSYGVDASMLDDVLTMGYTDGTRSSVAFVKHGDGMVCVVSGIYSNEQRSDLAQAVASGLTYCSEVSWIHHGSVTRGGETVTTDMPGSGYVAVYACLGGYFTVYGERHDYLDNQRLRSHFLSEGYIS